MENDLPGIEGHAGEAGGETAVAGYNALVGVEFPRISQMMQAFYWECKARQELLLTEMLRRYADYLRICEASLFKTKPYLIEFSIKCLHHQRYLREPYAIFSSKTLQ